MLITRTCELEERRRFLANRATFPWDALRPYAGRWIAWSPDGARIVAASDVPDELDDLVRAAGEDPERCVAEGIPATDAMLGGEGTGPLES